MRASATDREVIEGISRLSLRARRIVEGLRVGDHRSPYFGSSVEFAEHKEYSPGDDLRRIDWKLFGKSDRYYIKRYEEETNLSAHLLVDQSASMTWAGPGRVTTPVDKALGWLRRLRPSTEPSPPQREGGDDEGGYGPHVPGGSKLAAATVAAAALSWLLVQQGDEVGLTTFGGGAPVAVAPRARAGHVQALMGRLVDAPSPGRGRLPEALAAFAPRVQRRGVVMIFSDLLDDLDPIFAALRGLRTRRNDVVLFHTLHPGELDFPFQDVARFEDPEARGPQLLIDPREIRAIYLEELASFLTQVERRCQDLHIDYVRMNVGVPVEQTLRGFLAARSGRRGA